MTHRIRAAGILVEQACVLLMRVKDASGEYYIPPGGGVEPGDISTKAALQRECLEEAGIDAQIGELLAVREFHETRLQEGTETTHNATAQRYHAEFFYHITAFQGEPHIRNLKGLNDEHYIQAVEWVPVQLVAGLRTYPTDLYLLIERAKQHQYSLHLGCYIQGENDHINHL